MTFGEALLQNSATLERAGIATARLDCLVLLEDILGQDRAHLLAYPEALLTAAQERRLARLIRRRSAHEPLALLRHQAAFYGRTFYVDAHVLVPRPESEALIDLLRQLSPQEETLIADIGTGSGALIITAALEFPSCTTIGTDRDPACITVAKRNAADHHVQPVFKIGSLLTPFIDAALSPNILLCNLPYVPDDYPVNLDATFEPAAALYGGPDGLELYRALFIETAQLPEKPNHIIAESLQVQHSALADIARSAGYALQETRGLAQLYRQRHV